MDFEGGIDVLKLVELLKPPEEDIASDDDVPKAGYRVETITSRKENEITFTKSKDPETIYEDVIQQENEAFQSLFNPKTVPTYDIKYRQAVTTEDVFLQMSAKTPATASCEDMIVIIKLPGEVYANLELDVSNKNVKLTGSIHELDLPLPNIIDPDISKASWNQDEESLVLTLRMDREFDFVNF